MYWNEKINLIKKLYSITDFKDPFSTGIEIIKKIVTQQFGTTWVNFYNSDKKETLIKNGKHIKNCSVTQLFNEELPKLDKSINFWLLLINVPRGPLFAIYDCKYASIPDLLYYSSQPQQEFYIINKKYLWFLYFKVNRDSNTVEIHCSPNNVSGL